MKRLIFVLLFLSLPLFATDPAIEKRIDDIIAKHAKSNEPGCTVGVATQGDFITRAFGMANLEYDIPLTPDTIFEAGSVSKQFTAAAMVLLARDGKLSLDDRVRKYIPELPAAAYDDVTIRQMLAHTSGIRDWGTLMTLQGWRRGTRADSHKHVLELLSKQRALNFKPGTEWSYSNSNYNLAAIILERVTGSSFAAFVQERIFTPATMAHSSVRDDWTRIVKNRAAAYDPRREGGFETDIHFENIYGNCCILTTAGDLLRWNERVLTAFPEIRVPSTLTNGRATTYALGVFLGNARGTPEIYHSGATAGWRSYLTMYPDKKLSIAVLCNRGDAPAGTLVREIGDVFLDPVPPPKKQAWDPKLAGLYRDPNTDALLRFFVKDGELRAGFAGNGQVIDPDVVHFEDDRVRLTRPEGYEATYQRVAEWQPSLAELKKLAGRYRSDEIWTTHELRVKDGKLFLHLDPDDDDEELTPTFANAFRIGSGYLITMKGDGFDVKADFNALSGTARLERLHFSRVK
ncbi:MAG TPA: serine hydrolase domain-containing protein [Thermoanaerobaculia bacterium]|nr:serine hydrolase domain-containing protein [Thermoanaerobaculia bacterium]